MEVIVFEKESFNKFLDIVIKEVNQRLKNENNEQWIGDDEVKKILGIGDTTLFHLRVSGRLAFSKLSKKVIRYKRVDVISLLDKHYKKAF